MTINAFWLFANMCMLRGCCLMNANWSYEFMVAARCGDDPYIDYLTLQLFR